MSSPSLTRPARELRLTVPGPAGEPGPAWLAATLHGPPPGVARSGALLVCSPGGTYSRSCASLAVPGRAGYSMAAWLTGRGHHLLAVDTLGTGDSTRPPDGDQVTMDAAARALAAAASSARQLLAGAVTVIGLGHSLGGGVTVAAQEMGAQDGAVPFAAVAVLGYSPAWCSVPAAGQPEPRGGGPGVAARVRHEVLAELTAADPGLWADSYVRFTREAIRGFCHQPDVPADVIRAADRDQAPVPRGLAADFGITGPALRAAAAVRVPVFLGFGERDVPAHPHEEPRHYPGSQDVTLHILAGSGHCQYTASSRALLWARLDQWIASIIVSREDPDGQS
jgi:pimeloyl-ACP methyl ester carboxylesterase